MKNDLYNSDPNREDSKLYLDYSSCFKRRALRPVPKKRWQWGVIFRLSSFWVGVHYSKKAQRWCINVVPGVTVWIATPSGKAPKGVDYDDTLQLTT